MPSTRDFLQGKKTISSREDQFEAFSVLLSSCESAISLQCLDSLSQKAKALTKPKT